MDPEKPSHKTTKRIRSNHEESSEKKRKIENPKKKVFVDLSKEPDTPKSKPKVKLSLSKTSRRNSSKLIPSNQTTDSPTEEKHGEKLQAKPEEKLGTAKTEENAKPIPADPPPTQPATQIEKKRNNEGLADLFLPPLKKTKPIKEKEEENVIHPRSNRYTRLTVCEINDDRVRFEKKLICTQPSDEQANPFIVYLRGCTWPSTKISTGDIINVLGKPEPSDPHVFVVDDAKNLLIVCPDHFIACKHLAQTYNCERKAFIEMKFKQSPSTPNPSTVYGSIAHELFQETVADSSQQYDRETLEKRLRDKIRKNATAFFASNTTYDDAFLFLSQFIPVIQSWVKDYLGKNGGTFVLSRDRFDLFIHPATIEERIWSLMYGLRGDIDLTINATLKKKGPDTGGLKEKQVKMPLEFKSVLKAHHRDGYLLTFQGKHFVSHVAQVLLYNLLLSDRYDREVKAGALLSCGSDKQRKGNMTAVASDRASLVSLLSTRNTIAKNAQLNILPPLCEDPQLCKGSFIADHCMRLYAAIDRGTAESSGREALFHKHAGHLQEDELAFFRRWLELLDIEDQFAQNELTKIWLTDPKERENNAKCLREMIIEEEVPPKSETQPFRYTFVKRDRSRIDSQTNLIAGSRVILSIQDELNPRFCLAFGTVLLITQKKIIITCSTELFTPDSGHLLSQNFPHLMTISSPVRNQTRKPDCVWMIDLDSGSDTFGFQMQRTNLSLLCSRGEGELIQRNTKLRNFIIRKEKPDFGENQLTAADWEAMSASTPLNPSQKEAVIKVATAKDYAVICGMPGTGKSETLACVIYWLTTMGKTVLISGFTHTSVDNICLKIASKGVPYVRLTGRRATDRIHPEVAKHNVDLFNLLDPQDQNRFSKILVWATTSQNVGNALFLKHGVFDYCFIDEASQMTLPSSIGPILLAKIFVLIGDDKQLPPLVQSPSAGELAKSLFQILMESQPSAVSYLVYQYRMNEEIMSVSNEFAYHDKLLCGSAEVAKGRMSFDLNTLPEPLDWRREVLDPNRAVIWCNTALLPAPEVKKGDTVQNPSEASIIAVLTHALCAVGVNPNSIGIITPFNSQVQAIRERLDIISRQQLTFKSKEIETFTVDRVQGRDKDCILISLVRSNEQKADGVLLRDWRRLNVALTRAKKKMVIVGDLTTFEGGQNETFTTIIKQMKRNDWVYDLPPLEEGKEIGDFDFTTQPLSPVQDFDKSATPISTQTHESQQTDVAIPFSIQTYPEELSQHALQTDATRSEPELIVTPTSSSDPFVQNPSVTAPFLSQAHPIPLSDTLYPLTPVQITEPPVNSQQARMTPLRSFSPFQPTAAKPLNINLPPTQTFEPQRSPKLNATSLGVPQTQTLTKLSPTLRPVSFETIPKPKLSSQGSGNPQETVLTKPKLTSQGSGNLQEPTPPKPNLTSQGSGNPQEPTQPKPTFSPQGSANVPKPSPNSNNIQQTIPSVISPKPKLTSQGSGNLQEATLFKPKLTSQGSGNLQEPTPPKPKLTSQGSGNLQESIHPKPNFVSQGSVTVPKPSQGPSIIQLTIPVTILKPKTVPQSPANAQEKLKLSPSSSNIQEATLAPKFAPQVPNAQEIRPKFLQSPTFANTPDTIPLLVPPKPNLTSQGSGNTQEAILTPNFVSQGSGNTQDSKPVAFFLSKTPPSQSPNNSNSQCIVKKSFSGNLPSKQPLPNITTPQKEPFTVLPPKIFEPTKLNPPPLRRPLSSSKSAPNLFFLSNSPTNKAAEPLRGMEEAPRIPSKPASNPSLVLPQRVGVQKNNTVEKELSPGGQPVYAAPPVWLGKK